jgi:phosphohistidine swiveling domain-containing protein
MEKLEAHRKEYGWLEISNWIGSPLSIDAVLERVVRAKEEQHPEAPEVSDELAHIVRCLVAVAYAKQAGAEHQAMFTYHVFPFLFRVADALGLAYDEFIELTHAEITDALETGALSDLKTRARRRKESLQWAVVSGEEGYACVTEDAEDVARLAELVPKADLTITELKGQIGSKGIARGPAKVIMNLEEFGKFEEGDILMTSMTTPDFVMLMQKSAAIVTDIGGLLSHAAIMSRELGKPCVIGTKFATQVFKDGDMVEVDAEKGIVRILS